MHWIKVKCPMNKRQIVTLMHKLHYENIDTTDGYEHLVVDGRLEWPKFESFVRRYVQGIDMVFYATSQVAGIGDIHKAFEFTQTYMTNNRIRIASEDFLARIIIEPIGVGIGHLTFQTPTQKSGAGV